MRNKKHEQDWEVAEEVVVREVRDASGREEGAMGRGDDALSGGGAGQKPEGSMGGIAGEGLVAENQKMLETESARIEGMVDRAHEVGRLNRETALQKFIARLDMLRRLRAMKHRWLYAGSAAAALALFFVVQPLLMREEPQLRQVAKVEVAPITLGEITVPILIAAGEGDEIIAYDSLDVEDDLYEVTGEKEKVERYHMNGDRQKEVRYNRIIIPRGYTYQVALADGSRVTLNAGSELRYPENFVDSTREVDFRGEGYFEVAKSDKPFVVRSGDTRVKVYGTKFNFLYSEALRVSEAVLVEGSIGMSVGDGEVKILPNERVRCSWADSVLRVDQVDPSDFTGWMGTSFRYNGARLDKIMHDFSCWYGVTIHVSEEMRALPYTLEIDKSESIEDVMRMMELILDKTIKKEGGAYFIADLN